MAFDKFILGYSMTLRGRFGLYRTLTEKAERSDPIIWCRGHWTGCPRGRKAFIQISANQDLQHVIAVVLAELRKIRSSSHCYFFQFNFMILDIYTWINSLDCSERCSLLFLTCSNHLGGLCYTLPLFINLIIIIPF